MALRQHTQNRINLVVGAAIYGTVRLLTQVCLRNEQAIC